MGGGGSARSRTLALNASFPSAAACDTSYCPKPVACPEGSRPILTYEEGACCPSQNCSECVPPPHHRHWVLQAGGPSSLRFFVAWGKPG